MQKWIFNKVEGTLLHGGSSVNCLNWVTATVYMKVNTACAYRYSLVQTPERQNQCRFGALIVNFGHISHFVLVPF